jgi:hypothetical protein
MPPLPSSPALERVNLALAKEQGREANHKRHLSILLNSLRSDSIDVRLVAAGEFLIFLLQKGRSLIMASASSSPSSASRPLIMPARSSTSAAATSSSSGGSMEAEDGDVLFEDVPGADLLSATLSALLRCCDNVMRTHQGRKLRLK